jgi:hypothetical protein
MDTSIIVALIGAAPTVSAALIGRRAGKRAAFRSKQAKEEYAHAAIIQYAHKLQSLIRKAVNQGPGNVLSNAESIVVVRDHLRKRLLALNELLNSQIDVLKAEVERLKRNPQDQGQVQRTIQAVQVLQEVWSTKETQITYALAELLAELGFKEKSW